MKYLKIFGKTFNLSIILPLSSIISAFLFILNFILTVIFDCTGNCFFITLFSLIFFEITTAVLFAITAYLDCFDFIDDLKKKYITDLKKYIIDDKKE